jgi:hypothetical protein
MTYPPAANGLYLVKQFLPQKGVDHYGILDVGNRLRRPWVPTADQPVVAHQTPLGLRLDRLEGTGKWEIVSSIVDEAGARARIGIAATTPNYDLFGNNCEHFARFVAVGERRSSQVLKAVGVAVGVAVLAWAFTGENR